MSIEVRTDKPLENRWRVPFVRHDGQWEGPLSAYWEVAYDPISDDYTPREMSAADLLRLWATHVDPKHPSGLIPIYWFVQSPEAGKFNSMPFAYDHFDGEFAIEDFLTYFEWPEHVITGERLKWLTLPVVDKLWNDGRADKGGFIQEATGWKPGLLQPYVYLPSLLRATG